MKLIPVNIALYVGERNLLQMNNISTFLITICTTVSMLALVLAASSGLFIAFRVSVGCLHLSEPKNCT